jgi:hypothetical protein
MTYQIPDALQSLRPGAEWVLRGDDLEWLDAVQTKPTAAEIETEIARLTAEQPLVELRSKRNQLLTETDYLALADSTLTDEMRSYRQALRDLPANTVDPANPVWPVKPGGNS